MTTAYELASELKITVRQYRLLCKAPADVYVAYLSQLQQENRDRHERNRDKQRRRRLARSFKGEESDLRRNKALELRAHRSAVAILQDGRADTIEEARAIRRQNKKRVDWLKAIPSNLVCPKCGESKVLRKQWVVLVGSRAERLYAEMLMIIREDGYEHDAICRSCWDEYR